MRHVYRAGAVVLLGVLVLPAFAQPTPPGTKKDIDKPVTSEKMLKAGELVGKVIAVVESKKSLRLQVNVTVPKINEGAVNGLVQAQQAYQQALLRRDINGMRNAQVQMLQHQANMTQYESRSQEVEIGTIDEVKVRSAQPPEQFDDKGQLRKLTSQELRELKGPDPRLPGYNAEFADIHEGTVVSVSLVKKKSAFGPGRSARDKDADADLLADNLPQASLIVILGQSR